MLKLCRRNVEIGRTKCWNAELEMLNSDQVASSPARKRRGRAVAKQAAPAQAEAAGGVRPRQQRTGATSAHRQQVVAAGRAGS